MKPGRKAWTPRDRGDKRPGHGVGDGRDGFSRGQRQRRLQALVSSKVCHCTYGLQVLLRMYGFASHPS